IESRFNIDRKIRDVTYTAPDIDPDVQADIDACIAAVDAVAARETGVGVEIRVEMVRDDEAEEEAESSAKGTVEFRVDRVTHPVVSDDIAEPVREDYPDLVSVDESLERANLFDRIGTLERYNMRLRGMLGVERTMLTIRSRMTPEAIEEMVARRVEDENGDGYGGNGNGNRNGESNGNGNGNGNPNINVGARWFEKTETVFHISNCPQKYQTWKALMKLMTEVYCLWNEIQKMETELLNLTVKGNDLTAYNQRLQDAVRIANNLMDQKLKGYATRNAENKIRDNHMQQPIKRQNGNGQNVARAYTIRNSKKKGYAGPLPYYNKYKLHHEGQCIVKCGNCKRVGHIKMNCKATVATAIQEAPEPNHKVVTYYECGRHDHYRSDCPKLKN
nr:hypothetical protein [Tanacetum cinerariifolium]